LGVLSASHVESHSVREDPDLLEAQLTFAHLALSVFADHQVSCLEVVKFDFCVEGFHLNNALGNLRILLDSQLVVEKTGQVTDYIKILLFTLLFKFPTGWDFFQHHSGVQLVFARLVLHKPECKTSKFFCLLDVLKINMLFVLLKVLCK